RHNVPLPSVKTSCGGMQAGMMAETPRLTHHHIPQMPSSVPPPSKLTTRQYRKKPPPEVCAVCPSKETPEWRKGPSGLRTLCNACGLTAAKLALKEPKCIEDVWAQLLEIGTTRFRTQYVFEEHQKAAAARSWSAQWQSQAGGRTGNSNRSSYSSSTGSPAPSQADQRFLTRPVRIPK
ncbi:hypothetical protein KEM48_007519, partial [Puccinia striiformis f. sp. tritici PST-130]